MLQSARAHSLPPFPALDPASDVTHCALQLTNANILLWTELLSFLCTRLKRNLDFPFKQVVVGFHGFSSEESSVFYILNLIFLLAKYYIHKCKFSNSKPLLSVFLSELKIYKDSLLGSSNPKAIRTVLLLGSFNLLD